MDHEWSRFGKNDTRICLCPVFRLVLNASLFSTEAKRQPLAALVAADAEFLGRRPGAIRVMLHDPRPARTVLSAASLWRPDRTGPSEPQERRLAIRCTLTIFG